MLIRKKEIYLANVDRTIVMRVRMFIQGILSTRTDKIFEKDFSFHVK